MMVAHSKCNRQEECLEYWRQLVCVDGIGDVRINLETYHCAIKSAIVMCKWDEVGAILDMMKVIRGVKQVTSIRVSRIRSFKSSSHYSVVDCLAWAVMIASCFPFCHIPLCV